MEQHPAPSQTLPPSNAASVSSVNQLPALGPAPASLPPLAHPPAASNGSSVTKENKNEPVNPLQNQFESLSLRTPLQPPTDGDHFPSIQMNNEYRGQDEPVDIHSFPLSPAENDPNGDLSDGARGRHSTQLIDVPFHSIDFQNIPTSLKRACGHEKISKNSKTRSVKKRMQ